MKNHPSYDTVSGLWEYLKDIYQGVDAWLGYENNKIVVKDNARKYLPKMLGEDDDSWYNRIIHTEWNGWYSKGIRQTVDFLFNKRVIVKGSEKAPICRNSNNITREGYDLTYLLRELMTNMLIYGRSWYSIEKDNRGRYYLNVINPLLVTNWHFNDSELDYVLIKGSFYHFEDYVYKTVVEYVEYKKDEVNVYLREKDQTVLVSSNKNEIAKIPLGLVKYKEDIMMSPYRTLADLTKVYYQKLSYHSRKILLCCNPVPVIKDPGRTEEGLMIGPDKYINIVDPEGSFTWQEPLALSLRESANDLKFLLERINYEISRFLTTPTDRQTATATDLLVQPVESLLQGFLDSFLNGVKALVKLYNTMQGFREDVEIIIDSDIYKLPVIDSQYLFALSKYVEDGILSKEEVRGIIEREYSMITKSYERRGNVEGDSKVKGSTSSVDF